MAKDSKWRLSLQIPASVYRQQALQLPLERTSMCLGCFHRQFGNAKPNKAKKGPQDVGLGFEPHAKWRRRRQFHACCASRRNRCS
jgi:hypothetical protein